MGYGQKVKNWFFDENEEDENEVEEFETIEINTEAKTSMFESAKNSRTSDAVRALDANKDNHLMLFEPRSFGDSQEIGSHLLLKKAAVVNLHRLQKEQAKRVIDFLSGLVFAIDGDIQRIGPKIFLCTPKNIGVGGNIELDADELSE